MVKKGQKIRTGAFPPPLGNARKKTFFSPIFLWLTSLTIVGTPLIHHHRHYKIVNDQVVCHGDTRVALSKDGEDPYAEPKARGMFVKVTIVMETHEIYFALHCNADCIFL